MGPLRLCLQAVLHLVGGCSLGKKLSKAPEPENC